MPTDPIDEAIARFAHEIERRIPPGDGFITIEQCRDDVSIRGDKTGLLTLGAAILLRITAGESAYQPLEHRLFRMVPGGRLTSITVTPVLDERDIAKLRKSMDDPGWLACGTAIGAFVLVAALACLGLYTVATWIF